MTRLLTRENLKLLTIAVAVLLVAWTGPSVAHGVHAKFAHNADKVDGKHAVSSGASLNKAKKNLVAHDKKGQLPAKFIPDSFVTEGEYGSRPGTRMIAGGHVSAFGEAGAGNGHYHVGVWSAEQTGPGVYVVSYRAPGLCAGNLWPIIHVTKAFNDGEIHNSTSIRNCDTNTFSTQVRTATSAGAVQNSAFHFSVYGPGETVGPAPVPRVTGRTGGASSAD